MMVAVKFRLFPPLVGRESDEEKRKSALQCAGTDGAERTARRSFSNSAAALALAPLGILKMVGRNGLTKANDAEVGGIGPDEVAGFAGREGPEAEEREGGMREDPRGNEPAGTGRLEGQDGPTEVEIVDVARGSCP